MSGANLWAAQPERGDDRLVRFMVWLSLGVGRRAGLLLLYPIAFYFFAFSPGARRASRKFLERATGRKVGRLAPLRHICCFASVIFDRLFLVAGQLGGFRIDIVGLEHLQAALARGHGCVLLGAHLGSFEVMRAIARDCPVPVRPLMYRANGGALTRLLDRLNPELAHSVIEIGAIDSLLRAREALQRGEIIGILADRGPGGEKTDHVGFLGSPAPLPTGPMVLAGVLGVPALLFFGLRTGPRRYQVRIEAFADRVALRRETRQADLHRWLARYADRVAANCRDYPYNWFNFFDFWGEAQNALDKTMAVAAVAAGDPRGRRAAG